MPIFFHKKGALAFFGQRALGKSIRFLSYPGRRIRPSLFDFGGLLFEKESPKSYAKGLRGVFFCRFEVYRTAILRKEINKRTAVNPKKNQLVAKNTESPEKN